jgi:hypothetical protein
MNPPRVYELTIPSRQRINSRATIVQSMGLSLSATTAVSESLS